MKTSFIALCILLSPVTAFAAQSLDSEFAVHEKLGSFSMKHSRVGIPAKTILDEAESTRFYCRQETFGYTCEKEVKDLGMCGIIWNLQLYTSKAGEIRSTRQAIVQRCI